MFHIFGAKAGFERALIRERTTAGLKAARSQGRLGGRLPALSAEDLKAARLLLKNGNMAVAEVARRLKVSPSTLYRHLAGGRGAVLAAVSWSSPAPCPIRGKAAAAFESSVDALFRAARDGHPTFQHFALAARLAGGVQ